MAKAESRRLIEDLQRNQKELAAVQAAIAEAAVRRALAEELRQAAERRDETPPVP